MKRLLVMILFMLLLTGCGGTISDLNDLNMFVCIQKADSYNCYDIVYHKDTKVMYVVSHDTYNIGTFTLLVNPDGTPMLYEEESEEEE